MKYLKISPHVTRRGKWGIKICSKGESLHRYFMISHLAYKMFVSDMYKCQDNKFPPSGPPPLHFLLIAEWGYREKWPIKTQSSHLKWPYGLALNDGLKIVLVGLKEGPISELCTPLYFDISTIGPIMVTQRWSLNCHKTYLGDLNRWLLPLTCTQIFHNWNIQWKYYYR